MPAYPKEYQTKRRNIKRSSLDVIPPPPFLSTSKNQQLQAKDDSQHLLNLPNDLIEKSSLKSNQNHQQNSQLIANAVEINNKSSILNSSINLTNQLSTINNNYYGINCNYFTVPNTMPNNASYNSLNNSPIHNYAQLAHSNSFPNFNNLNQLPTSNLSSTSNELTIKPIPAKNQAHNALINLDNFKYQQFVLSKLQTLSNNQTFKKLSNDNLIDLGQKEEIDLDSNLLNLFDPLSSNGFSEQKQQQQEIAYSTIKQAISIEEEREELTNSMKSIQMKSNQQLTEQNFYESINYEKAEQAKSSSNLVKKEITFNNNLDFLKHRNLVANEEIINFKNKLVRLRSNYLAGDKRTNCGFVISSRLNSPKDICLSVKLIIDSLVAQSICFTCNVGTSVEHVICQAVSTIFDSSTVDINNFILKVFGLNEYLINNSSLGDYAYVNECHKFDKDVKLTLIDRSSTKIDFYARTQQDDENVESMNEYDLLPNLLLCKYSEINYESVKIFLNIIDIEGLKLLSDEHRTSSSNAIEYFDTGKHLRTNQQETTKSLLMAVNQAVKALCSYLGFETTQLSEAQKNLKELYLICEHYKANSQDTKLNDTIEVVHPEIIGNAILTMKKAIYLMLNLYSKVFPVNFYCELPDSEKRKEEQRTLITINECKDSLICKLDNLNELNCDWSTKYQLFYFKCELVHGEKVLDCVQSKPVAIKNVDKSPRIDFDEYINFEDQLICNLPRETFVYFTLIGVSQIKNLNDTIDKEVNEIGITSIRLFDHSNVMIEGMHLLGLWPEKYCTPIYKSVIRESFLERNCPLLVISLINTDHIIKFSDLSFKSIKETDYKSKLNMFDANDHKQIYHILNQDPLDQLTYEDKQTLWEKRDNLTDVPSALPKVLSSSPSWQSNCLLSIYELIKKWKDLAAIDAIQLLLPSYADIYVREIAINYIRKLDDDEIYDYLPQLVHAIRYETNLDSPLIWLLFEKSYSNLRIAHHFYWLLKTSLNDQLISWRMQVLFNAFLATCSSSLKQTLRNEELLLKKLNSISDHLKREKDDRLKNLRENLENVHNFLIDNQTSLPLNLR